MNITNAVINIIRDVLMLPDQDISRATTAQDVPGWDSFAMVKMLILLEESFKIKFETEELDELSNVGDLVDIISQKVLA